MVFVMGKTPHIGGKVGGGMVSAMKNHQGQALDFTKILAGHDRRP